MSAASSKKAKAASKDLLALCFELIADHGWAGFSFDSLARKAGVSLADIKREFRGRAAILDVLSARLDDAMLSVDAEELLDLPQRDRIFELMMSRLEALAPFRSGMVRLMKDGYRDAELILMTGCRIDRSMAWLQEAAGLGSSGLRSRLQRHLLTAIYLKALRTWSGDEGGDLAKTMASLDKDLRRFEPFAGLQAGKR